MIIVFAAIGGIGAKNFERFRSRKVKYAPIKVARLPKIMSGKVAPPSTFPTWHPINKPGIAAGVTKGRTVIA